MTDADFDDFLRDAEKQIETDDAQGVENFRLSTEVKIATSVYQKIDTVGQGYIDRPMLREYVERIRAFVCPDTPFDEEGFEAGFQKLDRDQDDKITLMDLAQFIGQIREVVDVPESFLRYSEQSQSGFY